MEIKRVGVVGCGQMGSGIAQVCAQSGYEVTVTETNNELLKKGLDSISARLAKALEEHKLTNQDKDSTWNRIKGTTDIKNLADFHLVIEAATENIDLKKKIFVELDKICPEDTILATNTSSQSIIDIAVLTRRPEKIVGLHFFNPVPVMKLIEVVKTIAVSADTLKISIAFAESLGKTPAIAQDTPGFIVNRLITPFMLNAVRLLESGIATKEDIDRAVTLGLNHPIGPLKLLDLIGIDTACVMASTMYEALKDPQYSTPILMQKMVAAGWLGRKTGKGFYKYNK